MASWGVPYSQWKEKKKLEHLLQMGRQASWPHLWMALKGSSEEIFPVPKTLSSSFDCTLGARYGQRCGSMVANDLVGWSGTWKERDWKTGDKKIWEGYRIGLSEWTWIVNLFVSQATAHRKPPVAQEAFNKQVDHTEISHPLSPATECLHNGLMNKVIRRNGG